MSRFVMRSPRQSLTEIEVDLVGARLAPEALRHVASGVFEDEDDERHHLRDAALAFERAVSGATSAKVTVGLSSDEGRHVPEALSHVAHEVFRDRPEGDRLYRVSRAVGGAFPQAPGPGC